MSTAQAPGRKLEVCVDDVAGLEAAVEGGADRIELCSSLEIGGLTPSAGLMAEAARCGVPVIALIRPRAGGFVYSAAEARQMQHDIEQAATLGLAGVAIGALDPQDQLDQALLRRLIAPARGLQLTLHRAFDLVADRSQALEQAVALGFDRILSSGGAATAPAGSERLAALQRQSRDRIVILAGSGIRPANVGALLAATGVREIHASCRVSGESAAPSLLALGFASAQPMLTSAREVATLKALLN